MTITQKIINYLAGYDISEKVEQLHHAIKEKDNTIHQLKETCKVIEEKYQSLYGKVILTICCFEKVHNSKSEDGRQIYL